MRKIVGILLFIGIIMQCSDTYAQPIFKIQSPSQLMEIGEGIDIYEDKTNTLKVNEVVGKKFESATQSVLNFGNTTSTLWCRFGIDNQTQEKFYLEINNPAIDEIELYCFDERGTLLFTKKAGASLPFEMRDVQTVLPTFALFSHDSIQNTLYYIKVKSNFPLQLPLKIASLKTLMEHNHISDSAKGIYWGFMLVMLLYNAFIFFTVRERIYLYYVLYVLSLGLTYATFKGYGFEFIWKDYPHLMFYVPTLASLVPIFIILFAGNFTEVSLYAPRWRWGLRIMIGIFIVCILLNLGGNYSISAPISQLLTMLMSVYLLSMSSFIAWKGGRSAKFFLLAFSVYLIGVFIYIAQLNGGIPLTSFTNNAALIGSAIEVVVLSLALADRINTYKKQKEQAQEEIIKHLKENERLIKEQNQILDGLVKEKTAELRTSIEELNASNEELNATIELVQEQKMKIQEASDELVVANEELNTLLETVNAQKEVIEEKSIKIQDSIRYAQKIQQASLPFENRIQELLPQNFVLYLPKDIVSGDFYWLNSNEDKTKIVIAVGDCTGHGVPGALMSMVGMSCLDMVVDRNKVYEPAAILDAVDIAIRKTLNQENSMNNDGMDLALCVLEYQENGLVKLLFAGAKRPLVVYKKREQTLVIYKGSLKSIGGISKKQTQKSFLQEECWVEKGDSVFLFSDGFSDQSNDRHEKYTTNRFYEFIASIAPLSSEKQKETLQKEFFSFKGKAEQRDDISVVGFCIS